jgi:hypothetical protein
MAKEKILKGKAPEELLWLIPPIAGLHFFRGSPRNCSFTFYAGDPLVIRPPPKKNFFAILQDLSNCVFLDILGTAFYTTSPKMKGVCK